MRVLIIKEADNLLAVFPDIIEKGDNILCLSPLEGHSYAAITWVKTQPIANKREIESFFPILEAHKYEDLTIVNSLENLFYVK